MGYENDYARLQKKTTKRQNDRAKPDICIGRNPLVRGLAPTEKGGVLLPPTTYLYPAQSLSPWVGTYLKGGVLLPPTTYLYPAKSLNPRGGTYLKGSVGVFDTRNHDTRCSRLVAQGTIMIYIFRMQAEPWIKLGFTSNTNPWTRARNGFWTNSHPTELCNKLGNLILIAAYVGEKALASQIKLYFPPDHGKFWRIHKMPDIVCYLNQMTSEIQDSWRPIKSTQDEKMPCCSGRSNVCYRCSRRFARFHQLLQHIRDMHNKERIAGGKP